MLAVAVAIVLVAVFTLLILCSNRDDFGGFTGIFFFPGSFGPEGTSSSGSRVSFCIFCMWFFLLLFWVYVCVYVYLFELVTFFLQSQKNLLMGYVNEMNI